MMTYEEIARVCHEVNRSYCEALGDMSQPAWEDAPQWQKDSAALGVLLHCEQNVGPEVSHERWMAHKIAEGWVHGNVKDPEAKTHPCIVPLSNCRVSSRPKITSSERWCMHCVLPRQEVRND